MAGGTSTLIGSGYVTWPIPVFDSGVYDSTIYDSVSYDTVQNGQRVANNTGAAPIANVNSATSVFSFFPNPNYGSITLKANTSGTFSVYTIEGQLVQAYTINAGKTELKLPQALAPGLYMGTYVPDNGGKQTVVRFVYQP